MTTLVVVTGAATALVLHEQLQHDLDQRVASRVKLAQTLRTDVSSADLVVQLSDRDIDVVIGAPVDPGRRRRGGRGRGPLVSTKLADGTPVTFVVDSDVADETIARLLGVEAIVGALSLGALLAAASWLTRRSLAPVDQMVTAAEQIAGGARGMRLKPERADTELGRLATSFDGMVDSLEQSESRMRQFVADASHELRTPTAAIQAAAEGFVEDDQPGEERDHRLFDLVAGTHRLSRLVNDLLDLERLEDPHRTADHVPTDLVTVIDGVIASGQQVTRSGDSAALVIGSPIRLTRLLTNLVENAIRHAGPHGVVTIDVRQSGGWVTAHVSDNGPGVAVEDSERIFDRFTRLDSARTSRDGGSGLGLAISRAIATEHRGTLTCIEPATGEGATFELRLPIAAGAGNASQ